MFAGPLVGGGGSYPLALLRAVVMELHGSCASAYRVVVLGFDETDAYGDQVKVQKHFLPVAENRFDIFSAISQQEFSGNGNEGEHAGGSGLPVDAQDASHKFGNHFEASVCGEWFTTSCQWCKGLLKQADREI